MEVLLFQMGKVASTAIAEALRREGQEVVQAHIAAPSRLQQKFEILTGHVVDDVVAERMYQDYLQELRATFLLSRGRSVAAADRPPVLVIAPMRDPLSWYWSNFAQDYDHNSGLLRRYHEQHQPASAEFSAQRSFWAMMSQGFDVLEHTGCAIDSAEALPQLMEEMDARDPSNVVFSQMNRFLMPLRWFDEDFLPATGIDVYSHAFDRDLGVGTIDAPGLKILLLRYENLADHTGQIADFVGVPTIELQAANVSEDKDLPFDLAQIRERAQRAIPGSLVERIYATRYARHFGYQ
jgi:Fe-S-cluster formation regulator IscX/YfhJ